MNSKIYLSSPHIGANELKYVNEAFETNWISPLGPNVNAFEIALQAQTKTAHAAALSSGTSAIHLALILLEANTNDTVFCQSITFSASANPIAYQKAKPVFATGAYYSFSTSDNASFTLLNDLLKAGVEVSKNASAFYVKHSAVAADILAKASVKSQALSALPAEVSRKVGTKRVGLWDTYGGSMPSGWLRWVLEQHHFDFKLVFAKEIDKGSLRSKFDVLIFVKGAIPGLKPEPVNEWDEKEPVESEIPAEYQETMGKITAAKSVPALRAFLEEGGDIITIGSSANLAYHLNLPVKNALVEMVAGKERNLPGEKFYIPGSVMQVTLDNNNMSNWGMNATADVYFNASPVFKLLPDAIAQKQITPLAWYATGSTLRSGWAFGQAYLQDGVAAFETNVGKGKLTVFGPEITFRAQTHGNFKLLFNQLYK